MKPIVCTALALGLAMVPGFAQDHAGPRPRREDSQHHFQDRMDRALNLTDAQKASVKEIRAKHKDALETRRKAAGDAREAFTEALRKPDTSVDELKKLHGAMASANLDLLLDHRQMRQEIRALLTPEQREKAAKLEGRMEGMRMGHRGGFPGGGMR